MAPSWTIASSPSWRATLAVRFFAAAHSVAALPTRAHTLTHLRAPRRPAVLDSLLTPTVVDIVFSRVKAPGERRIHYREFLRAVEELARVKVRCRR